MQRKGMSWVQKVGKQTFLRGVCKVWHEKDVFGLFLHVTSVAVEKELEWFCVILWHIWQKRNKRWCGKEAIPGLNESVEDFSEAGALMDEAKALISSFEVCNWGFVPRVCNRVAHEVVKLAISLAYPTYW
ncbi:hypothetical protein ACLB2K_026478 [Fragaria x ananassa]